MAKKKKKKVTHKTIKLSEHWTHAFLISLESFLDSISGFYSLNGVGVATVADEGWQDFYEFQEPAQSLQNQENCPEAGAGPKILDR